MKECGSDKDQFPYLHRNKIILMVLNSTTMLWHTLCFQHFYQFFLMEILAYHCFCASVNDWTRCTDTFCSSAITIVSNLFYSFTWTGLAVAADQDFKTFQAAYPYVVQKLLTDNSAATRRILNSVSIIFSGFQIILLNDFWVIALHELLIFFQDKGAFRKLKIAILTLITMRVF